ncbi:hypothetical protein [Pseudomonas sp. Leaf127]|uniref:hypothetical protein n=1 Tax=Pseudomonas sp. Leaf127 TaxID=1736267 RepID=UPI0012E969C5|nr:hypothetical protein [Pseudomonas sp. Leaf127]
MNITTLPAPASRLPAALEAAPISRAAGFSQILRNLNTTEPAVAPQPAAATLAPLQLQRGEVFIPTMSAEQRTSAVQAPDFVPAPAALETINLHWK